MNLNHYPGRKPLIPHLLLLRASLFCDVIQLDIAPALEHHLSRGLGLWVHKCNALKTTFGRIRGRVGMADVCLKGSPVEATGWCFSVDELTAPYNVSERLLSV